MTPRICFIGDSHIAALRQALNDPRSAVYKDRITMFGSRGTGLKSSIIRDGELISDDEAVRGNLLFTGGSESIAIDAFDVFCIVGSQVKLDLMERTLEDCAPASMPLPGRAPISSGLMDKLFAERLKMTLAYHLATLLHTTGKPVYLIGNPRHAEEILNHEQGVFYRTLIEAGVEQEYLRQFTNALTALFGPLAKIIPQPASLLATPMFTRQEFTKGSVLLARKLKEHPETDFAHMNADYGVAVLTTIMDIIDGDWADVHQAGKVKVARN